MSSATDVPAVDLEFVDPDQVESTYRVCLWAAPGAGKSVAAASAPGPILALSADRPSAYLFARKHWRDVEARTRAEHAEDSTMPIRPAAEIREVRYTGPDTLNQVFRYLESEPGQAIRTVIVDPVSNIIDQLRDIAPVRADGDIDHEWVNKKVLGFVQSLRRFDVNVVLVAYERLNDGKKGDGKLYPALGGPTLINKILGELDVAAHIERVEREIDGGEPEAIWIGQLQPRGLLVCKEALGVLGDRRVADLTRWFEVATAELASAPPEPVPWDEPGEDEPGNETSGEPSAPSSSGDGAGGRPGEPPAAPSPAGGPEPTGDGPAELPPLDRQPQLEAAA